MNKILNKIKNKQRVPMFSLLKTMILLTFLNGLMSERVFPKKCDNQSQILCKIWTSLGQKLQKYSQMV